MLSDIVTIFKEKNVNILSVLVYPYAPDEQYKILAFRVQTMNPIQLIREVKEHGYNVIWPEEPGRES